MSTPTIQQRVQNVKIKNGATNKQTNKNYKINNGVKIKEMKKLHLKNEEVKLSELSSRHRTNAHFHWTRQRHIFRKTAYCVPQSQHAKQWRVLTLRQTEKKMNLDNEFKTRKKRREFENMNNKINDNSFAFCPHA